MAGLLDIGALFLTLAVAAALALRVGLSVIPAYVVFGVLVGPNVAGTLGPAVPHVPAGATVQLLAELGIVLLLFFLGLEFSIERLLAARRRIVTAGTVDLAVNFPLGVALGLALGWSFLEATLLGGVVYVSSSAIVTKQLIDLGWIADPESEPILGTLVFEDLFVALYLAVVSSLVGGTADAEETARQVALALGFLLALAFIAHYGRVGFQRAFDIDSDESFVLRVLGFAVPVAGFALALGASEAVAAFFVGVGFSTTDHVERIERLLTPVRDVFAAVFFLWVGLTTDPTLVFGVTVPLAAAVLLTTPAKAVSGYYGGRTFSLDARRSLRVGLGLVPRGEFSLIIAAVAATGTGPVMTEVLPAFAVGYVLVMSLLGSVLMTYADELSAVFGVAGRAG